MVGIRLLRKLGVANERFVVKVVMGSQKWKVGPKLKMKVLEGVVLVSDRCK